MLIRPQQAGAAALALCLVAAPLDAPAQDYTLRPTFGEISVGSGFLPDPNWLTILAGGSIRGDYTDAATGSRCAGYFADPPDLRVFFSPREDLPLTFYVEAREDTVLLVNAPDGSWHCNDDTSGLNPALSFDPPPEGQYDIWVGTYAPTGEDYPVATLSITELGPFAATLARAFFGEDDRVVLDVTAAPWNMIGYVDLSPVSCTGTLIGPALVLTAAHCIATNGVIESRPVEFLAGFDRGRSVARSAITGYHLPAGWMAGEQEGTDFAFLYLADPIGDQLGWMDVGPLTDAELAAVISGDGVDILQAGYSYDQNGVLTGNLDCPFVALGEQNTLLHQCDTLQGDSGSPLFIADGGRYRIIGVESHTDHRPREQFDRNVAMYADYVVAELRALAGGGQPPVRPAPPPSK